MNANIDFEAVVSTTKRTVLRWIYFFSYIPDIIAPGWHIIIFDLAMFSAN